MTSEQFRSKWGNAFGLVLIRELISRVDPKSNATLIAAGREFVDDLQSMLGNNNATAHSPSGGSTTIGSTKQWDRDRDRERKQSEIRNPVDLDQIKLGAP